MKLLRATLILGLVLGLTAIPATEAPAGPENYVGPEKKEEPNPRKVAIKKYDTNGDWTFKKKEMKPFEATHPKMYLALMAFCEKATEHPKKFDVKFPPDSKPKKFKCKKSKIHKPYLKAWIKRTAD